MSLTSLINRVDVVKRDKDVVGKIKTSMSQNIYDADFEYGKQPLRWEEYTAGGGTITHLPGVGGCALTLPANSPSAITIRQSRPYHRYQPGKSMFLATAIQLGSANSNQIQRFGFFDDANGMFFEQSVATTANPSGMYCVIRSDTNYGPNITPPAYLVTTTATGTIGGSTISVGSAVGIFFGQLVSGTGIGANSFVTAISGTTVTLSTTNSANVSGNVTFQYTSQDVRFSYENWSDPQNIKSQIDWTKLQMFWAEYAWYGAGCLRWGVLINGEPYVLHEVGAGNNAQYGGGALGATTFTSATTTIGNAVIVVSTTTGIVAGMSIKGTGIPDGALVVSIVGGNVTMNKPAIASGSGVAVGFTPSGIVAWSRTGNLPVRYEQRDCGSATANTMYHYGVSVMLEGRADDQRGFTYSYGMSPAVPRRYVAPNVTRYPVLSIQPRVMGVSDVSMTGGDGAIACFTPGSSTTTSSVFSGTVIQLSEVQSFIVSGATTIITLKKEHLLPVGSTFSVTLAAFSPSGINAGYVATILTPSSFSIANSTQATALGRITHSPGTGNQFQPNVLAGRWLYYMGTDDNMYMARIVSNTAQTVNFVEPIQGGPMPVAMKATPGGGTYILTSTAGSNVCTVSGPVGQARVGMSLNFGDGIFPPGTVIASINGSSLTMTQNALTSTSGNNGQLVPPFYIGQVNRGQLLPKQLLVSSDSLCVVELIASTPGNPVVLTGAAFYPLSVLGSPNSFATRDVSATALTGGEVVSAFTTPAGGGGGLIPIDLTNFFPLYNTIQGSKPDILTVAVSTKATQTPAPPVASLLIANSVGLMTFTQPHGLGAGDIIYPSSFTLEAGYSLGSQYTVTAAPSANLITFQLSGFGTGNVAVLNLGTVIFSNGANVGAHLICQEAMS